MYDMVARRPEMQCNRNSLQSQAAESSWQEPRKGLPMIDLDDEPDQDKRIEKLRAELEKLGGGVSQHPELSADLEEAFLKHILAFETAEPTTLLEWLENAGLEVPPSDQLDDAHLKDSLLEVINRMASLGAYLHHTNQFNYRD